MPVILLDRLPLPSLQAYTVISVVLLSCSVYYAVQVTSDPNWKLNNTSIVPPQLKEGVDKNDSEVVSTTESVVTEDVAVSFHPGEVLTFMIQEPLCIWTLINMAYCCLILLGKFIQKLVFGELRVSEQQHIKDKFWNFVFYKFIFIFGVINVQYMDEVVLWCSWFSVLGFLHLLAQLCKDRFEYLSFSPTTPRSSHIRLLVLLAGILVLSGFMFLICAAVGFFGGLNTFAFMAAECVLLTIRTLHVMLRYALHLYDVKQPCVWEKRGAVVYYTELFFELVALLIDLVHHLHMLMWSNIFLSMASLVICMQLRYLFYEIQRRIKKHRNYLWVVKHMEQNYPMASAEELAANSDNCAICWEKMETARKLPCSHLFHNSCLQSWLEQDTSCPTCRMVLSIQSPSSMDSASRVDNLLAGDNQGNNQVANRRPTNHFFHFDGSRYVSWLPSFSVEVTHTQLLRSDQQSAQTSQLDAMARQVQQLFPHLPLSSLVEDLRITRSVELTIENVLDGRIVPPPPMFQRDADIEPQVPEIEFNPVPTSNDASNMPSTPSSWEDTNFLTEEEELQSVGEPHNLGGRFSKSSTERERILKRRKDNLLMQARRKYIVKHNGNPQEAQAVFGEPGFGVRRRMQSEEDSSES